MKSPHLSHLSNTLIEAAHSAGSVLKKSFQKKIKVSEKKGLGLVTEADLAAEEKALKILKRHYPNFSILTEESGTHGNQKTPGRFILDPLDGTTNFVHGFPMFCVSLAAEWKGQIVAGVIYHPILNEQYVAVKGKGAHLNGKRIYTSRTKKIDQSLLTTGFTYRKDEWLHREMEAFERLSGIARAIRRPGSAALDLAYTARGVFDGFWERRLSPWDVAAGMILVHEAGGKVTNFQGEKISLGNKTSSVEILACNKFLYKSLLSSIDPSFCAL